MVSSRTIYTRPPGQVGGRRRSVAWSPCCTPRKAGAGEWVGRKAGSLWVSARDPVADGAGARISPHHAAADIREAEVPPTVAIGQPPMIPAQVAQIERLSQKPGGATARWGNPTGRTGTRG